MASVVTVEGRVGMEMEDEEDSVVVLEELDSEDEEDEDVEALKELELEPELAEDEGSVVELAELDTEEVESDAVEVADDVESLDGLLVDETDSVEDFVVGISVSLVLELTLEVVTGCVEENVSEEELSDDRVETVVLVLSLDEDIVVTLVDVKDSLVELAEVLEGVDIVG